MQPQSVFPTYQLTQSRPESIKHTIHILKKQQSALITVEHLRQKFNTDGHVVHHENQSLNETHYVVAEKVSKHPIARDCYVVFSKAVEESWDYYGIASDLLGCHKFSRKSKKSAPHKIYINKSTKDAQNVLNLARARNTNKQLSNGRGDEQGTPAYFEKLTQEFAQANGLQITIIKGDDLVKNGFRLMHAVGRASKNAPTFVNLKYQGNPDSDKWVAFVGKGVCFDSGGLNIKTTAGMKDMYLDKSGATSVFSAFQYVVKEKLKINLTASMGFVQNFLSSTSYRPSDIFKSRKGLTVQIGNTDAEGRLVLADCMHWTQEKYKTDVLIELSTLTGAIIFALGHKHAGLFSNHETLAADLMAAGQEVHEESWRMPLTDYHRDLVKHREADITNSSGKTEAGSAQAAAFLENFVEQGTKWVHLDIAGTSIVAAEGTGYGAKILLQYARNYAENN